jgi:hypothetical protein
VETVTTNEDQLTVLREVLKRVRESKHVRAHVFVDRELVAVAEQDAPGIQVYRNVLHTLLRGQEPEAVLHEDLILPLRQGKGECYTRYRWYSNHSPSLVLREGVRG